MGRRKKKNNKLKNLGLGAFVVTLGVYCYLTFTNMNISIPKFTLPTITLPTINLDNKFKNESRVKETITVDNIIEKTDIIKREVPKVKVFFIGHKSGKDIYRPVYRINDSGRSNIEYAVGCLLAGPTKYEKENGVYSEIPQTVLLSINETDSKVVINLSESFGFGGGADSLYKRMFQLIKTVNHNTNKPVYLLINGRLAETLGGEGLMIKQPLNGSSLDD